MEENKSNEPVLNVAPKPAGESISKTALKKIRALTKDQLVDKLVALSNYAEEMKAANLILMYQVKQLNDQLNKNNKAQDEQKEQGSSNEAT